MSDRALVDELEIRIAYQDDTIARLGDEVYRQGQQLDRLAEHCRRLEQQLEQLRDDRGGDTASAEIPPHY